MSFQKILDEKIPQYLCLSNISRWIRRYYEKYCIKTEILWYLWYAEQGLALSIAQLFLSPATNTKHPPSFRSPRIPSPPREIRSPLPPRAALAPGLKNSVSASRAIGPCQSPRPQKSQDESGYQQWLRRVCRQSFRQFPRGTAWTPRPLRKLHTDQLNKLPFRSKSQYRKTSWNPPSTSVLWSPDSKAKAPKKDYRKNSNRRKCARML